MLYPELIAHINALLAWISNGLLIFLIVRHSPNSMANYKYLMLTFAIFGVIFGLIDITNQPLLHFYQASYVIFSKNPIGLPRRVSFWYIALNCVCYGMTLCLLSFHFVYRFLAVCKPNFLFVFSKPKWLTIPIAIFVFVNLEWWISSEILTGESKEKQAYFGASMLLNYGVTENEYTYVAAVFYKTNPSTGTDLLNFWDFAFVLNLFLIITSGFSVIFYCWYRIHDFLKSTHLSAKTREMQNQLLRALVAQTLFPVLFMFLPATCILIFPILKFQPGPVEGVLVLLITTEPFVDAIIPMYFIKNYRKAVFKMFKWRNNAVGYAKRASQSTDHQSSRV